MTAPLVLVFGGNAPGKAVEALKQNTKFATFIGLASLFHGGKF